MENLPNSIKEIPTHDYLLKTPGFEELKESFPEKNPQWYTIILIGRDCMWAHENAKDRKPTGSDYPIARHTKLGWVLMGNKNTDTGLYGPEHNVFRTHIALDDYNPIQISNQDAAGRYNKIMFDSQLNALSCDGTI